MKKILYFLVVAVLLSISAAFASQEKIALWKEVTLIAELPRPYGKATLEMKTMGNSKRLKISSMKLILKGKTIEIPKKAFDMFANPQLNTVELRSEKGKNKKTYAYIYFKFGKKTLEGKGQYPSVHIIILDNKVVGRSVRRQITKTDWTTERIDF